MTTVCPVCGSTSVRWHRGQLHNVQQYDNGARYLRGPHRPDCDRIMASRQSWEDRQARVDAAIAQARAIREAAKG